MPRESKENGTVVVRREGRVFAQEVQLIKIHVVCFWVAKTFADVWQISSENTVSVLTHFIQVDQGESDHEAKVKQSLYRPWGFQEFEASRFQDSRQMNLARLSALRTCHLYLPGVSPDTNFC